MRVVAEALGKDVQYDENTNTVIIKDKGDDNVDKATNNTNTISSKYVPADNLTNDPHNIIYFYNNIYYIVPDEIYFLAEEKNISTNIQDVIGNNNMELTLGDHTWEMEWVEGGMRRGVPFDNFIDEILPFLGIDSAQYIK